MPSLEFSATDSMVAAATLDASSWLVSRLTRCQLSRLRASGRLLSSKADCTSPAALVSPRAERVILRSAASNKGPQRPGKRRAVASASRREPTTGAAGLRGRRSAAKPGAAPVARCCDAVPIRHGCQRLGDRQQQVSAGPGRTPRGSFSRQPASKATESTARPPPRSRR